jgi:hypothetical protein
MEQQHLALPSINRPSFTPDAAPVFFAQPEAELAPSPSVESLVAEPKEPVYTRSFLAEEEAVVPPALTPVEPVGDVASEDWGDLGSGWGD